MTGQERRSSTRIALRVPIRFRPITNVPALEHRAETVNISNTGVYIATDHPLPVGTPIQVLLKMPKELTGLEPTDMRGSGRVVHVEQKIFGDSKAGLGVRIDRFEEVRAQVARVAS